MSTNISPSSKTLPLRYNVYDAEFYYKEKIAFKNREALHSSPPLFSRPTLPSPRPRIANCQPPASARPPAPPVQYTKFPTYAEGQKSVKLMLIGDAYRSEAACILKEVELALRKTYHLPFFLILGQASLARVDELDAGRRLGVFEFNTFNPDSDFSTLRLYAERRFHMFRACEAFSQFLEDLQEPTKKSVLEQEYGAETVAEKYQLAIDGLFDACLGLSFLTMRTALCASGSAASNQLRAKNDILTAAHRKSLLSHVEKAQRDPLFESIAHVCSPINEQVASGAGDNAHFWACWTVIQGEQDAKRNEIRRARKLLLHPSSPYSDMKEI